MVIGNLLALLQNNVKRLLAYSSIAHLGYLMVVMVAGSTISATLTVEAAGYYVAAYVLTSLAGFAVVSAISSCNNEMESLADFRGLFWRNPWLALVMTIVLLSLAGIPLTMGFIGKFYIITAGVEGQLWGLLALLVIGSGIGLYYYLRFVYLMMQNPTIDPAVDPAVSGSTFGVNAALAITAGAVIYYGVYPNGFIEHLQILASNF
jgi:NADH-quinone oxidoreductase subunit N